MDGESKRKQGESEVTGGKRREASLERVGTLPLRAAVGNGPRSIVSGEMPGITLPMTRRPGPLRVN